MNFTVTAGHGSSEPGNTWGGLREADLMDELGHLVARKLIEGGHSAREDGPRGENWPLSAAVTLVNGADLAVELHTNGNENRTATGVEVVARAEHRDAAQAIAHAIGGVLQIPVRRTAGWYDAEQHRKDRGWKNQAAFVRAGGLIVEVFFQSNPGELATYLERRFPVATAIARAMVQSVEKRA